jgi:hypothetical protein
MLVISNAVVKNTLNDFMMISLFNIFVDYLLIVAITGAWSDGCSHDLGSLSTTLA